MSGEIPVYELRKVPDNARVQVLPETYGNGVSDTGFPTEEEFLLLEGEYTVNGLNFFGRVLEGVTGQFIVYNGITVGWNPNSKPE